MPSPRTIVLIGATGFIGRRVARMLIAAGHKVIAPIRTISARREDLPQELETVHCSLRADDSALRDTLGRADAVIYAAGAVRGASIQDFLPANVHGVQAVADILDQSPPPSPPLLLMSSLAASEPQLSDYARSKLDGEQVLGKYPKLATTIFRPPAVYGPGDREMRPLFDAMRRGIAPRVGPPDQRLSLLHADDLARAILAWLAAEKTVGHGCLELHDGRKDGYTFEEIAAAFGQKVRVLPVPQSVLSGIAATNIRLAGLTGRAPMLSPGKVRELRHPRWICDNAAITRALDWTPEIPFHKGLADLYR